MLLKLIGAALLLAAGQQPLRLKPPPPPVLPPPPQPGSEAFLGLTVDQAMARFRPATPIRDPDGYTYEGRTCIFFLQQHDGRIDSAMALKMGGEYQRADPIACAESIRAEAGASRK